MHPYHVHVPTNNKLDTLFSKYMVSRASICSSTLMMSSNTLNMAIFWSFVYSISFIVLIIISFFTPHFHNAG